MSEIVLGMKTDPTANGVMELRPIAVRDDRATQ